MSLLDNMLAEGQRQALSMYKLAIGATAPSSGFSAPKVPNAATLGKKMSVPVEQESALIDGWKKGIQPTTMAAPQTKVGEELCTTCRKPKHYGPCLKPYKTRPSGEPLKQADFNWGMHGDDPSSNDRPSTSPHYHAATSSTSSLARAQEGRPADEQAATGFANLFRHLGITSLSDDTGGNQLANNMRKTAYMPGGMSPLTQTIFEQRGTPNPYDERPQRKSRPVGWGDEAEQRIQRAFDQIDSAVDVSGLDNGGQPQGGPIE